MENHSRDDVLVRIESELKNLAEALALLGLQKCMCCGKFSRTAQAGPQFEPGSICVHCVPGWWAEQCRRLPTKDRLVIERKLMNWLKNYHGAEIRECPPESQSKGFHLIAACTMCDGTGANREGGRCTFCDGRGTVWVITPQT